MLHTSQIKNFIIRHVFVLMALAEFVGYYWTKFYYSAPMPSIFVPLTAILLSDLCARYILAPLIESKRAQPIITALLQVALFFSWVDYVAYCVNGIPFVVSISWYFTLAGITARLHKNQ